MISTKNELFKKLYHAILFSSIVLMILIFILFILLILIVNFNIFTGVSSFIIQNIDKYVLFENILVKTNKYYPMLSISIHNLSELLLILCVNTLIFFANEAFYIIKKIKIPYLILLTAISLTDFAIYYFLLYEINFYCLILFLLIYLGVFFINFYIEYKSRIIKFLLMIPVINITLTPYHFMTYLTKNNRKPTKLIKKYITFITAALVCGCVVYWQFSLHEYNNSQNCVLKGVDVANIEFNKDFKQLAVFNKFFFNLNLLNPKTFKVKKVRCPLVRTHRDLISPLKDMADIKRCPLVRTHRDLAFNSKRNELYIYYSESGTFIVRDFNTLKIKKMTAIPFVLPLKDWARIKFDNASKTIAVALEFKGLYILDMDTLKIKKEFDFYGEELNRMPDKEQNIFNLKKIFADRSKYFLKDANDSLIYNKFDNSYVLSFWTNTPYFISVPVDAKNKEYKKIEAPKCQGGLAMSNRNKEIYLALHQRGKIYVYDALTYKFKREIKTVYGVRYIYYNEQYDILVAPSFCNGHTDIFLIDGGTDALLERKHMGYHLRKPLLRPDGKILFIPSSQGLHIVKTDIGLLLTNYYKDN